MPETLKLDCHCHSSFSDGTWDPEALAQACAAAEVRYAALTDHNSIDGLDRFEAACNRQGVGFISGLELAVFLGETELHLLCYGFDRQHEPFVRMLKAVGDSINLTGSRYALFEKRPVPEVIQAVHEAGGIVLLAHPLTTEPRQDRLEAVVENLIEAGLDGLEVDHPMAGPEQRAFLRALAARKGLVVSGGTDHHGMREGGVLPGVELPLAEWKAFRERLVLRRRQAVPAPVAPGAIGKPAAGLKGPAGMRLLTSMALPAIAAVFLFTVTLFAYFLPSYEKALMDRKREMIRELTRTVWSLLDEAEKAVQAGRLSPAEARQQAIERVRGLRYGREGKDYFWLQDLTPKMLMHPYRTDLEGQDLSGFRDPRGVAIFSTFAETVRRNGEGYVDYVWQWKDDPLRLEAKESYLRLYEPWGLVIGTGLYIQDVVSEIHALKRRLGLAMGGVFLVLVALLLVMLRGGLRADRLRAQAEARLQESSERYRSLVKAAAEGILFVRHRRCVYANPVFLEFADRGADELPLLDWSELFPGIPPESAFFKGTDAYVETLLRRRDGSELRCRVMRKVMAESGSGGFMVLVRRSEEESSSPAARPEGLMKRLLNLPSSAAEDIARDITTAAADADVVALCGRVPGLVSAMLDSGASPAAIARMITSVTDSATTRFIELAQADLGPAPTPFAFVALGSQGRREQTLFTDQDNALIYEDVSGEPGRLAATYYAALSVRVCEGLARSGYRNCKGMVMANNPKWCQPLATWKGYFTEWISKAEEHDLMEFGAFFDMRGVAGEERLVQAIRDHVGRTLRESPAFHVQAARTALLFKSPLRLFGTLVQTGRSSDRSGLDLKAVMMPIVSFARVYALQRDITFTSTPERLSSLSDLGVLLPSQYHDILTVFETLLRLRLRHQSSTIQQGGEPDNLVDPARLGHIDEAVLKECYTEIDRVQERIRRDFLGGESALQ